MTRPVVSADDVRAAHRRNEVKLQIPPGALITPLARDEASRWGIEFIDGDVEKQHTATCDDPGDTLEQIVARVQARVPGADPTHIREIARRVLARLGK